MSDTDEVQRLLKYRGNLLPQLEEARGVENWERLGELAQNLRSTDLELKKRGVEPGAAEGGTSEGGSSSGGGTPAGTPGADVLRRLKNETAEEDRLAEMFFKMTGPERTRLYLEDKETFQKLAKAYERQGMRKLIGGF